MSRPRFRLRVEPLEDRATPAFGFDPTFGTSGQVITAPPDGLTGAVAVQDDGRILTIGTAWDPTLELNNEWLELRRLNADGTPDTSFGTNGRVAFGHGLSQFLRGMTLDIGPDGGIYAAASIGTYADADATVFRFTPTGAPDAAFGTDGVATFDFPGGAASFVNGVRATTDGRVVVVGGAIFPATRGFDVARLNADGTADTSFDEDGFARFEFGQAFDDASAAVTQVAVTADGKIVIGGNYGELVIPPGWEPLPPPPPGHVYYDDMRPGPHPYYDIKPVVVRFNADGSADTTFDGDGAWFAGENGSAGLLDSPHLSDMAVQTDGKVLLVAAVHQPGTTAYKDQDAVVARLNADGSVDTAFGTNGRTAAVEGNGYAGADRIGLLADGRIVVVAARVVNPLGVAILSADGVVIEDAFVGGSGLFNVGFGADFTGAEPFATPWVRAEDVAIGPDGRIVITGIHDPTSRYVYDDLRYGVAVLADRPDALPDDAPAPEVTAPPENPQPITIQTPPLPDDSHLLPPAGPSGTLLAAGEGRWAFGDVNGDGTQDTITVTAPGVPIRVTVVSGTDSTTVLVPAFDPFGGDFTGGGFVAAADLDGDGRAEFIVSPDQGGGPRVTVFSMNEATVAQVGVLPVTARSNFFGIDDPNFRGGVRVALGDVNGDGTPDLAVSAGFEGGPRVALFDGKTLTTTPTRLVGDFFAFPDDTGTLRNGAFVALGDVDGDGKAELIAGGGPGGAARVLILSGAKLAAGDVAGAQASPVANFFVAGNMTGRDGVRVTTTDSDRDGRADVTVNHGERWLRTYSGKNFVGGGEPTEYDDLDLATAALPSVYVA